MFREIDQANSVDPDQFVSRRGLISLHYLLFFHCLIHTKSDSLLNLVQI